VKRRALSRDQLRAAIQAAWDEIPQSTIDKLVLSFEGRAERCVAAKGASVPLGHAKPKKTLGHAAAKKAKKQQHAGAAALKKRLEGAL
jgi:hypothetical protein